MNVTYVLAFVSIAKMIVNEMAMIVQMTKLVIVMNLTVTPNNPPTYPISSLPLNYSCHNASTPHSHKSFSEPKLS